MKPTTLTILAVLALGAGFATRPAAADAPATVIEVSASSIGLQPGNVYGPWQFATLDVRTTAGADDLPGFTLVTRHDLDSGAPSSGTSGILDDYHQWTPRLFTYAQIEFSSGTLFPTRGAYLEADPTVSPNVVIAEGYGVLDVPIGLVTPVDLTQRYVNVGPEFYFPNGSVTVRYIPLWTQGQVSASSLQGNLSFGNERSMLTTLSLQSGVLPAYAATNPAIAAEFQDRVLAANLSVKRWVSSRFGFELGVDAAHASDRFTGKSVYDSLGATLGVFVGVGHSSKMP